MRTIQYLLLFLALAALPLSAAAQEVCDPTYTATDYRFYALDAAALGDAERAESLYACWEAAFPDDDKLYLDRAAVRAEIAGDYAGALADLERAEALTGSVLVSGRRLAVTLAQGDFDAAVRMVEALEQDNRWRILGDGFTTLRRAAYQGRAMMLVEASSYEAALADFELAFEGLDEEDLTPADGPMVLSVAEAFLQTGQLEQAARGYTAYVGFMGSDADPEIVALVAALEENGVAAFFAGETVMRAELATGAAVGGSFSPFRFSPDGSIIGLYFYRERRLQLFETATGAPLAGIDAASDLPGYYAFSPDGTRIAVIGSDGALTIRDTAAGDVLLDLPLLNGGERPAGLAFADDAVILLVGSGEVRRFNAETGRSVGSSTLDDPIPPLAGVFFSADGASIAVVRSDIPDKAALFSLTSGRQTGSFEAGGSQIISDWSGDLRFAAVVRRDSIALWTPALGGTEVQRFEFGKDLGRNAALDAAGETLVFGDEDGLITAIDLASGTRRVIGLHAAEIAYVEISADGRLAAALDRDGTVRLWEIRQGD
ncbi:MAG: hypothetical protein L6Q98_18220 [Anaerolineae bacterium]|nr:hypothetical protein [Anaerolineae bacterium]NUQ06428.1 hypothetical protein [Anaerolineae bacterium]